MFKNYREDWVFRATYDYDSGTSSKLTGHTTVLNNSVPVIGLIFPFVGFGVGYFQRKVP